MRRLRVPLWSPRNKIQFLKTRRTIKTQVSLTRISPHPRSVNYLGAERKASETSQEVKDVPQTEEGHERSLENPNGPEAIHNRPQAASRQNEETMQESLNESG
jgi:hypothetical protein